MICFSWWTVTASYSDREIVWGNGRPGRTSYTQIVDHAERDAAVAQIKTIGAFVGAIPSADTFKTEEFGEFRQKEG